MNEVLKHIAELSPESLDLLMKRLQEKVEDSRVPVLRRGPIDGPQPLSFPQELPWFLEQLKPGNHAYNVPTGIRFDGPLDVSGLEHSLNEITRRHAVLRTVVEVSGGEPLQIVRPHRPQPLPVLTIARSDGDDELRTLIDDEVLKPFDLASGPLFRAVLFQVDASHHILLLVMHHIVFDGWSMGVFLDEMVALYQAFVIKEPASMEELPLQYSDFARWQREWLQGQRLEFLLSYWQQKLQGMPSLLELPADYARPPVQSLRGAAVSFALSAELAGNLKHLSALQGVTLFMTLLAAFKVLIFRYTGQNDLVLGTPVANRTHVELEKLIGFFVNTLALRTEITGDLSFIDLLQQVRDVTLDAYAHQELPFEKLVDVLEVQRTLSHPPLIQVVFGLHNVPLPAIDLEGLTISEVAIDCKTTKYDLTLSMFHDGQGLRGLLEYNTDLFAAETATRFAEHFVNLLESVVSDPLQPVSRIEILSERERRHLLKSPIEQQPHVWERQALHQIFAHNARRRPNAVAVSCGE